jgi:transcriptional regulator with XRE-family HTH domain
MAAMLDQEHDLQRTISVFVRMLMARDRLTQGGLGERLGMDHTTVSAKLRGRNNWSTLDLKRLGEVFGVHPGVFYGDPKELMPKTIAARRAARPAGVAPPLTKWYSRPLAA